MLPRPSALQRRRFFRLEGRAVDQPVTQGALPSALKGGIVVDAGKMLPPIPAQKAPAIVRRFLRQCRQEFVDAHSLIQRLDQRLHQCHRAVEGAGIAPAFQIVRFRYMPVTFNGGLILIETEMNSQRHALEVADKVEIGRRIVNWIGSKNE